MTEPGYTFQPRGRSMDGERLIVLLSNLLPAVEQALPPGTETALHDIAVRPPQRLATSGQAGEDLAEADIDQILALKDHEFLDETVPAGGGRSPRRRIVAVVRDTAREPVAALTITVDLNMWFAFQGIVEKMLGTLTDSPAAAPYPE